MTITFSAAPFETVKPALVDHLNSLPAAVDSFIEFHLFDSSFFAIDINGKSAGFAAIHQNKLLTHYSLADRFKKYGQPVFAQVKKLAEVQAAFVPTCDEFFLSHALDEYHELRRQAYFFAAPADHTTTDTDEPMPTVSLRIATTADIPLIEEHTGDFFGNIPRLLNGQELFLAQRNDELVGFGVAESGRLVRGVASIGMFVLASQRQNGYGTAILKNLQHICRQRHLRPIAGCWVYNHLSKKTLEKAGMFTQTRLLKVEF